MPQTGWVVVDRLRTRTGFARDVGEFGTQPLESAGEIGEGCATVERSQRGGDGFGGRAVGVKKRDGGASGVSMGGRVGKEAFFVVEALILVGVLDTRRVDLGDLVTKKVDLSGSSSFVAAQFG